MFFLFFLNNPWCSSAVSFQDGEMLFHEEVFLEHKSSSMRQFLQSAVHLQFFKQVKLRASC